MTNTAKIDYFSAQFNRLANHAVDSTLGILGFKNKYLRHQLSQEIKTKAFYPNQSQRQGMMGVPVFDPLFYWETQEQHIHELNHLLHPKTIQAIKGGFEGYPYKHQLLAWQTLSNHDNKQSLVITSGTGSGKTECFMVPILNDLVQEYHSHDEPQRLEGVRALFLYPLNALINSQKERLDEWTKPFDENIQFCLYNGLTEEHHNSNHKIANQIQSRQKLRMSPPPILLTNATMLEYMLIRQNDRPILEKSKGKLRWIVLDEAHSYLGSNATELSLLLKRTMSAFGVTPEKVHFVATSATIGEDEESKQRLIEFLAGLSGVSHERIHVIGAKRHIPTITPPASPSTTITLKDIKQIDPNESISLSRYEALSCHPFAYALRQAFLIKKDGIEYTQPKDLQELLVGLDTLLKKQYILEHPSASPSPMDKQNYLLRWLDICSFTKPNKTDPAFLPLRMHLFQRTLMGLHACVNPDCVGKHQYLADSKDGKLEWQFGYVYSQPKLSCDYCNYPVFELRFCNDCQTPHLLATYDKTNPNQLIRPSEVLKDEFSLDEITDDDEDETENTTDADTKGKPDELIESQVILMPKSAKDNDNHSIEVYYLSKTGTLFSKESNNEEVVQIYLKEGMDSLNECSVCESKKSKTPILTTRSLSAPFYVSEAIPILLDYCESQNIDRPYNGKTMISFTDSRQGTARISMKIAKDSQIRAVNHIVHHHLSQFHTNDADHTQKIQHIKDKIDKLNTALKDMPDDTKTAIEEIIREHTKKLDELKNPPPPSILWTDMIRQLVCHGEFKHLKESLQKVLSINDITSDESIAHLLLLNVMARRPKNQNSLETMGLTYLEYPALKEIKLSGEPLKIWQEFGFEAKDWQDYLKLILDFFVRDSWAVQITDNEKKSMNTPFAKSIKLHFKDFDLSNQEPSSSIKTKRWLTINTPNNNNRLIRLLTLPKNLDLNDKGTQDKIRTILKQAWIDLINKRILTSSTQSDRALYSLDLMKVHIYSPHKVYVCPITHRFLDTTLKGYTPYIPKNALDINCKCQERLIPKFQSDPTNTNHRKQAAKWLDQNAEIRALREDGLWADVNDAVVAGMSVILSQEHSAQIDPEQLKDYEARFKHGQINILNCSTTMEMGVDIGNLTAVAMNNVPPHPANYLQRIGRAGRRRESQAVGFTICKQNPHEEMVFNNTRWAFDTQIRPPYIILNSQKILQRHINAYLLAMFLNTQCQIADSHLMLKVGAFFLNMEHKDLKNQELNKYMEKYWGNEFKENTPYKDMKDWLRRLLNLDESAKEKLTITQGICSITQDTDFYNIDTNEFIKQALKSLDEFQSHIIEKVIEQLKEHQETYQTDKSSLYARRLAGDIHQFTKEPLLAILARLDYLPRYGFPIGLVKFETRNKTQEKANQKSAENTTPDGSYNTNIIKAVRDLPIALREYAPGNNVAVDGLIYESAGISLNHYRHQSNSNEFQLIQQFKQCGKCGAISGDLSSSNNIEICQSCGGKLTSDKHNMEFIEPMGFQVDYYAKPKTHVETFTYVPITQPKIQANGNILPLFNPDLGRIRTDTNAKIFHHSKGIHGKGYLICLGCGRTKSAKYDPTDDRQLSDEELEEFMNAHSYLKGGKQPKDSKGGKNLCSKEGKKGYHLYLGSMDSTSAVELYLTNPATQQPFTLSKADSKDGDDRVLLTTLSVAFKNALAQCHGISPDELGSTIKPLRLNHEEIGAIVIYDKASGGAGFSDTAPNYIAKMFELAKASLECPEGCGSACHGCLLTYDTRFIANDLNRHVAISYFNDIKNLLALPEYAKLLPQSQYCTLSISDMVGKSLSTGYRNLTLYLQGKPNDWAISSALSQKLYLWQGNNISVELSISEQAISALNEADKYYLASLPTVYSNISISTWQGDEFLQNHVLLQLTRGNQVLTLACTDKNAYIPNDEYFWQSNGITVQSYGVSKISTNKLTLSTDTSTGTSFKRLELKDELNVSLQDIGTKFWQHIISHAQNSLFAQKFTQKCAIKSIEYSDRYVRSPLVASILGNVLYTLKQHYEEMWIDPKISIRTLQFTDEKSIQTSFYHNWKHSDTAEKVLTQHFKYLDLKADICVYDKIKHQREFVITWTDESISHIVLDHGFGFLKIGKNHLCSFDFSQDLIEQAKKITDVSNSTIPLENKELGTFIYIH